MNESCHTYEWVMSHIHGSVMAHMYIRKNVIHTQICIHFHTYVDIYITYEYLFSAILNFKNGLRRAKILERLYQLGCTRVFFPIFPCKFHMRGSAWWVGKKKMNLCAHVCVHVCMCVCLCVCVCSKVTLSIWLHPRWGGGLRSWKQNEFMCTCVCACVLTVCAHVCVHVCMCVCVFVYACVCALERPCQFGCTRVGGGAWGVGNKKTLWAHVCMRCVHVCVRVCVCVL